LKVQPDHSFAFVQYCLPRVLFSADDNASAFLKKIDLLRVAPIKAIGYKSQDPEEYAFQAFKFKQDKEYFDQLVTGISKLVQLAKAVGDGASYFVFDPDCSTCATIRLKHTTFPQLAEQLDSYPKVLLDNNHTLYLLPNLAYEKAIQKCVSSLVRYPTNVCQGIGKITCLSTPQSSKIFAFNLEPAGLVCIPVQLRPLSAGFNRFSSDLLRAIREDFGIESPRLQLVAAEGGETSVIALNIPMPNEHLIHSFGKRYDLAGDTFILELASPLPEQPRHGPIGGTEESVSQHRDSLKQQHGNRRNNFGALNTIRPLHLLPHFERDLVAYKRASLLLPKLKHQAQGKYEMKLPLHHTSVGGCADILLEFSTAKTAQTVLRETFTQACSAIYSSRECFDLNLQLPCGGNLVDLSNLMRSNVPAAVKYLH
jgi:hypothetical protein